ncbi:MAG: methylglyoxal synthase [Ruminococcaceae bacterium]|nr:methylglyoxal synthase [Oscillospiraceae bacterium]
MNIALLADDGKKELMVQFCIAYCGALSGHTLIAENTTGKLVSGATGLSVRLCLNDKQGAQQIAARVAYNEIDLVLYFCDPLYTEGFDTINSIERLCDQYLVPMATNAATAEVLVQGLRRGDLDWRDIVNPKRK